MLMKLRAKIRNQKGFTLIELLVVISIIGVLAAVAVPKYMDSTAGARTAKVQADLSSLDSAIQLYSANNGGSAPSAFDASTLAYINGGTLPTAPTGIYKIGGTNTTSPISAGTYGISGGTTNITLGGTIYTAASLK